MSQHDTLSYLAQFTELLEVIEPGISQFSVHQKDTRLGISSFLKEFVRENGYDEKEKVTIEHLLEFQSFVESRYDFFFLAAPFIELIRRSISRVIDAYTGEAIFIGDHHHIYQPDRFDKGFADFIHDKVSRECYEKMARLYRFYSVDIGPTLAEWLRSRRPDIYQTMLRSHRTEPFIAQSYTHRILPLIREEEDLLAEVLAGLLYHERTFGYHQKEYPRGMWLPECCISRRVAAAVAAEGIDFVILRSDQTAYFIEPGQVYHLETGESTPPLVAFFYHSFSRELSFDKWTTDNPALTLDHFLSGAQKNRYYLLAHDGELVHHRFEHCGVDVTGFFRELPLEAYRRSSPFIVMMSPAQYLRFLRMRASLMGEPLELPFTSLPDFPTSWSCGGYGLRTFKEEKGTDIDSLPEKSDSDLLSLYAEFLVLRDLQRSDCDPVDEETWKIMVKMKKETLLETYPGGELSPYEKQSILDDIARGVNICYDNRRFLDMKVAGAGRWAYGSLDSGDSRYQTYLHGAATLLEEQVHRILSEKTGGLFRDRARAKAFFLATGLERLENLKGSPEERLRFLQEQLSKTITAQEALCFKSKEEFFQEHLVKPGETKDYDYLFALLKLWSLVRAAKTSCAYFFDDLNNHVSEDAVLRIAEVVHQLEDVHGERVSPEVFESLRQCKSRFRASRGQGPDVTAYEVATRHLNILRIRHYITKYEEISIEAFNDYIKNNPYGLPHPEGSSREYYRAFVGDRLIGFTSFDGVELVLSRLSREVSRTGKDLQITVEKRDLENGEIINRLQMEVKYSQLIAEKPYVPSAADPDLYLSIKLDDRDAPVITFFVMNNVVPALSEYGLDRERVQTIYVNRDRISFDYADIHTRSRRKGPSKSCDVLYLRRGLAIEQFASSKYNLKAIAKEKQLLSEKIKAVEEVNHLWMEKLPGHLEHFMQSQRVRQVVYGYNGSAGILKQIEKSPQALQKILEGTVKEIKEHSLDINCDLLRHFVLQRVFLSHDYHMGNYEIEQKVKHRRSITMEEAAAEYCEREHIPYVKEMIHFKLWKYRSEEIKRYGELTRDEERCRRYLHQNMVLKSSAQGEETFTLITHPIVYLHGAANEANNETYYPDNEVIPRIIESSPSREVSLLFIPGSVAYADQLSYLKKIRRYMGEKFGISDIRGALFATGEKEEIQRIRDREKGIFTIPSLDDSTILRYFPEERHRQVSSRHLDIDFTRDLDEMAQYLSHCDIIFIGGGNSFILGQRLMSLAMKGGELPFRTALKRFIVRGGLLMTLSAGTMVAGSRIISYKVKKMERSHDIEGLAIVNAALQVHFEEYGLPEHLHEIRAAHPGLPAIGIDTFTALIDFATLKVVTRDPSVVKNSWDLDETAKRDLVSERLVVMGSKTLQMRTDRTGLYLDGQPVPALKGLLCCLEKELVAP
ncbi:MAG: Type 1 glutamine amidotransferase-like domain-containing protein [Candidatus Eremiobacteraeota bacterium]|nr:Type 1 glutamine amidotransferase-like domain-containing protein [Candidatus Eremiobacteraeota bacterium]